MKSSEDTSGSVNYLPLTLVVGGVQMMMTVDLVAMGVLLPSIGQDFAVSAITLSRLVSFPALVIASMMLIGGRLADIFGRRTSVSVGLAIAASGSLIAGFAPSFAVLLLGRLIFGLGAAIMIPANFSIITTAIPDGPPRHRAFGVFGMVQGLSLLVGPGLEGWLATHLGWRSAFLLTALLMATLLLFVRLIFPGGRPAVGQRFDFAGAALVVAALVALVTAISGGSGLVEGAVPRLILGGTGLVLAMLFIRSQRRANSPLLPLDAFSYSGVKPAIIAMMAAMAASSALFILPGMVMQRGMHWSAAQAGLGMLPHALSATVMGQLTGWFMGRFALSRNVQIGLALLIGGLFANGFMSAGHGYPGNVMLPMLLGAAGSIFTVMMLTAVIVGPQPSHQQGAVSALAFTCQQLGIALGSVMVLAIGGSGGDPFVSLNRAFWAAAGIALCGLLAVLWPFVPDGDSPMQSSK